MIDSSIIFSIFLTGIALSWGPCMTNCTMILLPYVMSTKTEIRKGLDSVIWFSIGKIVSYMLLCGLAGYSGSIISKIFYATKFKIYVNILISILLFLIGLSILIKGYRESKVCDFIHRNDFFNMFLTGIFIGILPCAPLFAILAIIILKANSFFMGSILGFIFGIGTFLSPIFLIVISSIFLSKKIFISKRLLTGFQRICGVVMMVVSIFVFITNTIINLNI